jgi:hypothetical protein
MEALILQNNALKLEFSRETGALIGLTALETGWKILDRPQLGLSFRLLLPLEGMRNNPVYGEKQTVSSIQHDPGMNRVSFTWERVMSERGGEQAVRVTQTITLSERQAVYETGIDNQSGLVVENVYSPYLGDVQHPQDQPGSRPSLPLRLGQEWNLWPTYDNLRGYYGVDYPTQFSPWGAGSGAPMSPFILLRGENQGLYAGVAAQRELVAWHTELRPGYGSSIDFRVPEESTIAGKDVHTRFAAVHVPYIQPGETRTLTPVALEAYQGGWQHGVDIYKHWRDGWMKLRKPPEWAREPHAWQQIHINSPEDELRLRFTDLP